ncbi:hypothetical protein CC78DRAFT_573704 [Lojkania enalia]|uniref:Uncharacterized protein n=1 Tax=Lojkania enalia TaxID=147567 RepID=A0A9P4NC08_9PLEO|nr:hypothetical protein CC78DRAFT_573704 [Didymosphaeria enalia]
MLSAVLAVSLIYSGSLTTAQTTDYYFSYQDPESDPVGYIPNYEICGNSCSDCADGAVQCLARNYTDLCYEPDIETCCQDVYGTACLKGFYCAYNPDNVAYCCQEDRSLDDCANLFNEDLSDSEISEHEPSTVYVTRVMTATVKPTELANFATNSRVVQEADRTPPPKLPGVTASNKKAPDEGLSTGAKAGIAIGVIFSVSLIAGAAALFIIHRRRKKSYNPVGDFPEHVPMFGHSKPPSVSHGAPGSYEPTQYVAQPRDEKLSLATPTLPTSSVGPNFDHSTVTSRSVPPQPSLTPTYYQDIASSASRSVSPQQSVLSPFPPPGSGPQFAHIAPAELPSHDERIFELPEEGRK